MTGQQLRALRRKHLLRIIRNLENNLQKAIREKEELMLAYQSGRKSALSEMAFQQLSAVQYIEPAQSKRPESAQ